MKLEDFLVFLVVFLLSSAFDFVWCCVLDGLR